MTRWIRPAMAKLIIFTQSANLSLTKLRSRPIDDVRRKPLTSWDESTGGFLTGETNGCGDQAEREPGQRAGNNNERDEADKDKQNRTDGE
ncbi:hypothetical protein BDDG_06287 [Blastomyces dermatitidis ATCC 18188]|uniref:Uncharacterized protein n=1 Tax=Ajellomyces dermatitidis (strain ATCC 18188 / CBS 674.68) TaxID=653446 RepID=F2TJD0_AJEDA|nr:hypothetical protein BDDG_06287 [Blastomyces dermatitidis ATCC 18188]EQL36194.1 hypothetical protein BDFG_02173 [Blastomyces dermatitidis ATCC 26199]